ncbi:MAG: helix-turn-helix transcriptional regulator [Planctomycetales bacterium]|nr:helix-turn-helix transcriptional regulator [Planctomycetales bacterium]
MKDLFPVDLISYTQFDATCREASLTDEHEDEHQSHSCPAMNRHFHEWSNEGANRTAQCLAPVFEQVIGSHPLAPYGEVSLVTPSKRVSDVLGNARFRETAFYREYFRHFGVKYQMVIPLEITPTFHSGVTLDHGASDFTKRDLELANLIRPHVHHAFKLAIEHDRLRVVLERQAALLEERGVGQLDVSFDGSILRETNAARLALILGFPHRQVARERLPAEIHEWLRSRVNVGFSARPADRDLTFRRAGVDGVLSVNVLSLQYEVQRASLLISYAERFDPIKRLHRDGLTRREAEVLYCLTLGNTDKQIATALGIKAATARTHVERIRRKLGVPTRTGAAAIAVDWLHGHG